MSHHFLAPDLACCGTRSWSNRRAHLPT